MWMTVQNQLCIGFLKHEFLLIEQSICPFYALERETSEHLYSIVLVYGNYRQNSYNDGEYPSASLKPFLLLLFVSVLL